MAGGAAAVRMTSPGRPCFQRRGFPGELMNEGNCREGEEEDEEGEEELQNKD